MSSNYDVTKQRDQKLYVVANALDKTLWYTKCYVVPVLRIGHFLVHDHRFKHGTFSHYELDHAVNQIRQRPTIKQMNNTDMHCSRTRLLRGWCAKYIKTTLYTKYKQVNNKIGA